MIRSFAETGADVTVMCLRNAESRRCDGDFEGRIRWSIAQQDHRPQWRSLFSSLPNIACRCAVPEMRQRVVDAVTRDRWDAIVIDSLSVGWTIGAVQEAARRSRRPPRIVHISHNHEETTRRGVALTYRGNPLKRAAMLADVRKVAALERRVVDAADLVSAISPADAVLYAARRRGRPVIELSPGYDGRRVPERRITPDVPRRVVVVGTFDWVAKQVNLRQFLEAAVEPFAKVGAELAVIGDGGSFIDEMRRAFPSVHFTGRVESVYPYFDDARIAVVPEHLGGGFKLKALDYVFNRVPIAAIEGAFEGVPLVHGDSVLAYPDFPGLVRGIVDAIDDFDLLNRLQERAYAACDGLFDWPTRGRRLNDALSAL